MNIPIQLTGKEILYAASKAGAERFIGIEDTFLLMTAEELYREIPLIQNSLVQKGYADLDFNGIFSIHDSLKELMRNCAFCDKYLSVEKKMPLNITSYKSYYVKEDQIVRIGKNAEGYEIIKVTKAELSQEINSDFSWNDTPEAKNGEAYLDQLLLEDLKEKNFSSNLQERLEKAGCKSEMIKLLRDGIKGSAEVFQLSAMDLRSEKDASVSGIYGQAGILELYETEVDFEEKVKVSFLEQNDLWKKIKNMLMDFGLWEEEQFV